MDSIEPASAFSIPRPYSVEVEQFVALTCVFFSFFHFACFLADLPFRMVLQRFPSFAFLSCAFAFFLSGPLPLPSAPACVCVVARVTTSAQTLVVAVQTLQ